LAIFINNDGKEIFRMNGYYKPKLFKAALKYIEGKHYKKLSFNAYSASIVESTGSGLIDEEFFSLSTNLKYFAINSRENNKEVVLLFSQDRCDACIDLHAEKFKNKEVVSALTKKYNVLKINTLGNKKIKDLEGQLVTESHFSEALNIKYTPTLLFMKDGREIFRYESYLNNEDFSIMIEYITTTAWSKHISFQKWLRDEKIKRWTENPNNED
jgi:thioredoxin-related protein